MFIPDEVKNIIERLTNAGYEAYIVGGCVRDGFLGTIPEDYDVATSALPQQVKDVFCDEKIIDTGLKHGTVTIIFSGMNIEITTYRVEDKYSDNRHPDNIYFTRNLKDDLSRRDFTINALAYNDKEGIIDCFFGIDDLNSKTIRCVGDPDIRFSEDSLRILRALRFSSVLGFEIESNTQRSIYSNKELIKNISSERIANELFKIICGKNAGKIIKEYCDVLSVFIPELACLKFFKQKNTHHNYDFLTHTAITIDNTPNILCLRLAALFHDIGKPRCLSAENNDTEYFKSYSDVSAYIAEKTLKKLKVDTKTQKTVVTLVKFHQMELSEDRKYIKHILSELPSNIFYMLLELMQADCLAENPDNIEYLQKYKSIKKITDDILLKQECYSINSLALNGDDLIGIGIAPGRELGQILNYILNAVIDEKVENNREVLVDFVKHLKKNSYLI